MHEFIKVTLIIQVGVCFFFKVNDLDLLRVFVKYQYVVVSWDSVVGNSGC